MNISRLATVLLPSPTPALLFAVGFAVAIAAHFQPVTALEPETIAQQGREITVQIGGMETGSGILLERQGNTYTILTNWRVVDTPGDYTITTNNGDRYAVSYDRIRRHQEVDLALLEIESDRPYPVAELETTDLAPGTLVYLAGWAEMIRDKSERQYALISSTISSILPSPEAGYSLLYDTPGTPGTWGGAVLNSQGQAIAVNGRSVVEGNTQRAFGLGIPLQPYLANRDKFVSPGEIRPPSDALSRGNRLFESEDYAGAIEAYSEAIANEENLYEAHFKRGEAHIALLEDVAALDDFNWVLRADPNNAIAYYYRGLIRQEVGDYNQAINDYSQAIALAPELAPAYNNRGSAYSEIERYDAAIADLDRAIALSDRDPDPFNNRGVTYRRLGELERAIADYTRAISLAPDDAEIYTNRAVAYRLNGEVEAAIADFDLAIGLDPDYAPAYNNRGNLYRQIAEYRLAIEDYTQVLRLDPSDGIAYYNRGLVYGDLGERDRARSDFQQAANLFRQQGQTEFYRLAQQQLQQYNNPQ